MATSTFGKKCPAALRRLLFAAHFCPLKSFHDWTRRQIKGAHFTSPLCVGTLTLQVWWRPSVKDKLGHPPLAEEELTQLMTYKCSSNSAWDSE